MRILAPLSILAADVSAEMYEDPFPIKVTDMSKLFQTMEFTPEKIQIPFENVPEWINGVFYRNGPTKYEYGDHTEPEFDHFFDPTAGLQAMTVKDGQVFYQSRITESSRYKVYEREGKVCRPEVGTYREDDWVTEEYEGEPINEHDPLKTWKIMKNRMKFLIEEQYATDNTNIAVHSLHGYLFSFTETTFINYHDPVTLETIGTFNMREAKTFPKDAFCQTQTAHGHFDDQGSFWNVMGCMRGSDSEDHPGPHVAYYPYKIPNAQRSGPNQFENPLPKQDFLDSIIFGDPFFNTDKYGDFSIHYHHMTSITQEYVVVPLNSLKIDLTNTVTNTLINALPLTSNMIYDEKEPGTFVLYSMKEMKEAARFETDPFFIVHMINAYDDPNEKNSVVIDTTQMADGDILNAYFYDVVNKTGDDLYEEYSKLLPLGYTQRYTIKVGEENGSIEGVGLFDEHPNNDQFECYMKGGVEFPILNWGASDGKPYDHFWAAGFGAILPDRLYHIQWSTKERYVWMEPKYSPGEPVFVQKPGGAEDEGILISLVSPFSEDLAPFIVFLDAQSMAEITRGYLPEGLSVPVGFHSLWIDLSFDREACKTHCDRDYLQCNIDCQSDQPCMSSCSRDLAECMTSCETQN